ncbi:MAG: hypothetical protein WCF79_07425 [Rhodomicrobium sp.]
MEAGMALAAVKLDNTVKVAAAAKKSPRDITYSLKTNTLCKLRLIVFSG